MAEILRTPLKTLLKDLQESSRGTVLDAKVYIEGMRDRLEELLPGERQDAAVATHLSSVLLALSSLEKNRGRATRSTS